MTRFAQTAPTLLRAALALTIPAYVLTNHEFRPLDHRISQQAGAQIRVPFDLGQAEPLDIEVVFSVIDPTPEEGQRVRFLVNGELVSEAPVETFYLAQRHRFDVASARVRAGGNVLIAESVAPDSPSDTTLELSARIHNYSGINTSFPRAFVVDDDSVALFFGRLTARQHVARFLGLFAAALAVVWITLRLHSQRRCRGRGQDAGAAASLRACLLCARRSLSPFSSRMWT